MNLDGLISDVKNKLQKKMNIKQSLSIMNIPKQKFLDKGDLVILMDDRNEILAMEWFKDGSYHIDIKGEFDNSIITNILKNKATRLFESSNFDPLMDIDYVIDYKTLGAETKNKLKAFHLFKEGALRGDSSAQVNVALLYAWDENIVQDKMKAYENLKNAMGSGKSEASQYLDKLCKESVWVCKE